MPDNLKGLQDLSAQLEPLARIASNGGRPPVQMDNSSILLIREALATLIREVERLGNDVRSLAKDGRTEKTITVTQYDRPTKRLMVQAVAASAVAGAIIGSFLTLLLH